MASKHYDGTNYVKYTCVAHTERESVCVRMSLAVVFIVDKGELFDGTGTGTFHHKTFRTLLTYRFSFVMKWCQGERKKNELVRCVRVSVVELPVKNPVEWHRALARFYRIQNPDKIQKMFFQTIPKCHQPEYLQIENEEKPSNKLKLFHLSIFISSAKNVILCNFIFHSIISHRFKPKNPINTECNWSIHCVQFFNRNYNWKLKFKVFRFPRRRLVYWMWHSGVMQSNL